MRRIDVKCAIKNCFGYFLEREKYPNIISPLYSEFYFLEEYMFEVKRGNIVTVMVYGGEKITRRCAGTEGDTVLLCQDEEFFKSIKENRQPICIGFKFSDIISVESDDTLEDSGRRYNEETDGREIGEANKPRTANV